MTDVIDVIMGEATDEFCGGCCFDCANECVRKKGCDLEYPEVYILNPDFESTEEEIAEASIQEFASDLDEQGLLG